MATNAAGASEGTAAGSDLSGPQLTAALGVTTNTSAAENAGNASLYNKTIIYNRWETDTGVIMYVVPVVFILVFILGVVGNGTLIVSVLANKVMRNVPNILIVSLSLGDFLLILVSVPMTTTVFTFISWPYGEVACKANEYVQTLSLGVSVFTLCALSADRYVAIVDPMAKMTGRTQRTTVATAVGIWIVSALLAVPDAIFSTEIRMVSEDGVMRTYCWQYPEHLEDIYPHVLNSSRLIVYLILPVLIIGYFYTMMARMLIRSNELVPVESKSAHGNHQRQMDARKKVARVVLSFVIIFIVCWLPRHVYIMWYFFDDDNFNDFWIAFKVVGFCLTFVNSCVNPFALYFLSSHFRKYYNRYLFCLCRQRRYTPPEQNSTMQPLYSTAVSNTRMSVVNTPC